MYIPGVPYFFILSRALVWLSSNFVFLLPFWVVSFGGWIIAKSPICHETLFLILIHSQTYTLAIPLNFSKVLQRSLLFLVCFVHLLFNILQLLVLC